MRNRHHNQPDAELVEGLTTVSRRGFVETVAKGGGALAAVIFSEDALSGSLRHHAGARVTASGSGVSPAATGGNSVAQEIIKEKIRKARLSGPPTVTDEATIAEMDTQGKLTTSESARTRAAACAAAVYHNDHGARTDRRRKVILRAGEPVAHHAQKDDVVGGSNVRCGD